MTCNDLIIVSRRGYREGGGAKGAIAGIADDVLAYWQLGNVLKLMLV
jgi:hypothetical protein